MSNVIERIKKRIEARKWKITDDAFIPEVIGMQYANKMNDWCLEIIGEELEKEPQEEPNIPLECVDGSCPMALSEEYEERGMDIVHNCEECPYQPKKEPQECEWAVNEKKLIEWIKQHARHCENVYTGWKTDGMAVPTVELCKFINNQTQVQPIVRSKSIIEIVANTLGVKLYEEFTIKPSKSGTILGHKTNENTIYRFDTELVHKGYDDGWSEWYGNHSKELYYLILGLYEIVKKEV